MLKKKTNYNYGKFLMKLRSLLLTLAVGSALLILLAVGSFTWIINQSALRLLGGGVDTQPTGTMFVPKQAPLMASLLVNPERLESLRQLTAPVGKRRQAKKELNQLKKSLLANLGLDYQEDIKDWLGEEITIAVTSLDFDRNSDNGNQPGYLLVTSTQQPEKARQFLQASYSKKALAGTSDLIFEQYKGINLIYQKPKLIGVENNIAASAVVGEFVLFANHPKVLKDAINNVQATELSLLNSPNYQKAINSLVDPRIGVVYLNLPAVSAWISNLPWQETPDINQLLTTTISVKPQGLLAQTAIIGLPQQQEGQASLTNPVEALNYLPSESILAIAGTNLDQFWASLTSDTEEIDATATYPALKPILEKVVDSVKEVDLPQDIFSWVEGEYALGLIPLPGKRKSDWIFVAEQLPDANSDEAIAHLDDLAKAKGNSVNTIPLFDRNTVVWSQLSQPDSTINNSFRLDTEVKGVHTNIGKYSILSSSLEALAKALAASEAPLISNQNWIDSVSLLPQENQGYVYLDWEKGREILEKQFPLVRVLELSASPLFDHLQSLTITSLETDSNSGIKQADILFNLQE